MSKSAKRVMDSVLALSLIIVSAFAVAYEFNGYATIVSEAGFSAEANITASMQDSLEYSTVGAYTEAWGPQYIEDSHWDSSEVPGTASAASTGTFSSQAYGFANYCVMASVGLSEIGGGWEYYPMGYDCEVMAL